MVAVRDITKTGYYYSRGNQVRTEAQVIRFPYTDNETPFELSGNSPIHEPTYVGDIAHLIVLDKNWVVVVLDNMSLLYDEIEDLSTNAMSDDWTLWTTSCSNGSPNYTHRNNTWAHRDTYIAEARKNIGELTLNVTTNYDITSTDDSNYTSAQNPTTAEYVYACGGKDMRNSALESLGIKTQDDAEIEGIFTYDYLIHCYLQMPTSLVNGDTYTITLSDARSVTFIFDKTKTVSRAIKVNQVGYHPDSGTKKAYLGAHLYGSGELDLSHASAFNVINADTGNSALSGTISLVEAAPVYESGVNDDPMYGEDVYEADFSALTETGTFYLSVDGVGRSWPFEHKSTVYAYPYFVSARGLYHQRAGTALSSKHSYWTREKARLGPYYYECDHIAFPQNVRTTPPADSGGHSAGDTLSQTSTSGSGTGFSLTVDTDNLSTSGSNPDYVINYQDETDYDNSPTTEGTFAGGTNYAVDDIILVTGGTAVVVDAVSSGAVTQFRVSSGSYQVFDVHGASINRYTRTAETSGGWHDASDWDCRDFHYAATFALLYAYQLNPTNLTDDQLNIPESGDGVPDVLSEARHSLEVWRNSQNASGGISGYLETKTHPLINSLSTGFDSIQSDGFNKWDYCYARRTRFSSLIFAAAAAQYARLVQPFDSADSTLYQTAAIDAYNFGTDASNDLGMTKIDHAQSRGVGPGSGSYAYTETDALWEPHLMHAKLQLYLLTGTESYITDSPSVSTLEASIPNPYVWTWTREDWSPWVQYSIIEASNAGYSGLDSLASTWETWFLDDADTAITNLADSPYPTPLARNSLPGRSGIGYPAIYAQAFAIAYEISGLAKYKTALFQCMDYMFGCNCLGMSWTTGIGYVYPVWLQMSVSRRDSTDDPFPGITVFGVTNDGVTFSGFRAEVWASPDDNDAITSITQTGGTATVTTTAAHGLTTGDPIEITGADIEGYNVSGTATVSSTTVFTYAVDSGTGSPETGSPTWRHYFVDDAAATDTPEWRQFSQTQSGNVVQNEYTIHETMAPMVFACGYLCEWEPQTQNEPRDTTRLYGKWHLI